MFMRFIIETKKINIKTTNNYISNTNKPTNNENIRTSLFKACAEKKTHFRKYVIYE